MNDLLGNLHGGGGGGGGGDGGDDYRPRARRGPPPATNPAYNGAPARAGGRSVPSDVEMGAFPTPAANEDVGGMKGFFESVETIKADLAQIRTLQQEVHTVHEASKTLVKSKEVQRARQEMQVRECMGLSFSWHLASMHD